MAKILMYITIYLLISRISNSIYEGGNSFGIEHSSLDLLSMCKYLPPFILRHTNMKCTDNMMTMEIYYNSTRWANYYCQLSFKNRPWNCSANSRYLARLAEHSFPETSYLFALYSASLAHSFMEACSRGILESCRCTQIDVDRTYHRNEQLYTEGYKCAEENIEFGVQTSRYLLTNDKENDARWLVDNHNKEAGRQALLSPKLKKRMICTCHGISGACAVTKCVRKIPLFAAVSAIIMDKYLSAVKVGVDNYQKNLVPYEATLKHPTKEDLVYSEESPEFCEHSKTIGSLGTQGRICDGTDTGPGSCDVLCCNRGYNINTRNVTKYCECRFRYCCKVICNRCNTTATTYTCK